MLSSFLFMPRSPLNPGFKVSSPRLARRSVRREKGSLNLFQKPPHPIIRMIRERISDAQFFLFTMRNSLNSGFKVFSPRLARRSVRREKGSPNLFQKPPHPIIRRISGGDRRCLGYINTAESEQKKGQYGTIK